MFNLGGATITEVFVPVALADPLYEAQPGEGYRLTGTVRKSRAMNLRGQSMNTPRLDVIKLEKISDAPKAPATLGGG